MRTFLLSLLALASLIASMWCFGVLLVSCSGHPPYTAIGIWILPVSAFGGGTFFYLAMVLWRLRHDRSRSILSEVKKTLPKKTVAFFISLVVVTFCIFLFSWIIVSSAISTEMPDWAGYVIEAAGYIMSIALGILTYRKISRHI